jgi:DNA uptake protein ComE-like DNA-binding protein
LVVLAALILLAPFLSALLRGPTDAAIRDDSDLFAAAERLRTPASPASIASPAKFPFDPNTVSASQLIQLGLSKKQAAAWIKYRSKRPFRQVADIGRLFVLRPEQRDRLMALAELPTTNLSRNKSPATYAAPPTLPPQRFRFDPNTISADSLQLLGLSEREASALLRYRGDRPTTFRKPDDLLRLRSIDSIKLASILDLVAIQLPTPSAPAPIAIGAPTSSTPAVRAIDVNTAKQEDWEQLPGIGPYRAGQIMQWRDRLGGFVDPEQVAATQYLPDSSFQRILPYLNFGTPPNVIRINRATAAELASHPYLDRRTAAILIRYRDNHGPYTGPADLEKVRALSTESRERVLPYLNFDP